MATKAAKAGFHENSKMAHSFQSTMKAVVESQPVHDVIESTRNYIRANPEAAALWAFGIGFVLAWKIKPW